MASEPPLPTSSQEPDRSDEPAVGPPAERPRGLVGWFSSAIGEALQAAFAIAIALVAGIFKAMISPEKMGEEKGRNPGPGTPRLGESGPVQSTDDQDSTG